MNKRALKQQEKREKMEISIGEHFLFKKFMVEKVYEGVDKRDKSPVVIKIEHCSHPSTEAAIAQKFSGQGMLIL